MSGNKGVSVERGVVDSSRRLRSGAERLVAYASVAGIFIRQVMIGRTFRARVRIAREPSVADRVNVADRDGRYGTFVAKAPTKILQGFLVHCPPEEDMLASHGSGGQQEG